MAETMHKQVLNEMPVGYALHKLILNDAGIPCDCEYIEVNKAFEETTGLKASDVVGKRTSEIFPDIADDVADINMSYIDVALNGISIEHEQNLTTLGKWYRISAYSPEKGYFVTLIDDITKEKESNKNLAESNKLLSDFLDSNEGLIFLKNEKLSFTFVNRAFCDFWNKSRDNVIGKTDNEIYPPELNDRFRQSDIEVLNNRCTLDYEVQLLDRTFKTTKFPIKYPNGDPGIGAYITEITDQKMHQESMSRQLFRQNILIDVFMRNFGNQQELLEYTLHRALELTGSQYGYIYLYDEVLREFTLNS